LQVTFADHSTGSPTSWQWNFGDASPLSTQQNPVHTYAAAGTYNVTLTVTNAAGSSNAVKPITVP
jgi:PKD repeat protein